MQKSYLIGANTIVPDYFCVTPKNGATEVAWKYYDYNASGYDPADLTVNFEYSYDKKTWTNYVMGTVITTSDSIYFRGKNNTFHFDFGQVDVDTYLSLNKSCDLSGRLSSLTTKIPTTKNNYALGITNLYQGTSTIANNVNDHCCSYIHSIKDLKIDVDGLLAGLFEKCINLIDTPQFILKTLERQSSWGSTTGRYYGMFAQCTNISTLPKLSVTTLSNYCYANMFSSCPKIKLSTTQTGEYQTEYRIPITGTGVDATNALANMFRSTGGTFTGTPNINTTYYTSNEVK